MSDDGGLQKSPFLALRKQIAALRLEGAQPEDANALVYHKFSDRRAALDMVKLYLPPDLAARMEAVAATINCDAASPRSLARLLSKESHMDEDVDAILEALPAAHDRWPDPEQWRTEKGLEKV